MGNGRYEYVLSNLSVFFWRWATWKVFDAHPSKPAGVVAFITTAAYTNGPGFAGMREYLRRTADEGWIIDLSPEGHQPDVSTRVFPGVQHQLCIGIFARYGKGKPSEAANIHHATVSGTRAHKFEQVAQLSVASPGWVSCATGWQDRLVPAGNQEWEGYPLLGDLMPWQAPGVKPNRTWVHAPAAATLRARWNRLIGAPASDKPGLLKETPDRMIGSTAITITGLVRHAGIIGDEKGQCPSPTRIGYRAFDRQYLIPDTRLIDRPRPALWQVASERQVFVAEQHDESLTAGPGLVFTADVPDIHFFNGRGGRILPLYRDSACMAPNIAPGLLKSSAARLA